LYRDGHVAGRVGEVRDSVPRGEELIPIRTALELDLPLRSSPRWLPDPGGANAARHYLIAGLVDEMEINLVPTLVRTVATPTVTHFKFARP
jgi:hypothetical protein